MSLEILVVELDICASFMFKCIITRLSIIAKLQNLFNKATCFIVMNYEL